MKLKVYLDTSVFSALYDERVTDRQSASEEFWARRNEFELSTSELAKQEISETLDEELRKKLSALLEGMTVHPVTEEMKNLAMKYIEKDVFSRTMYNDALHVAAAGLTRQDILLSWNFKHLVNRRRRMQINEINVSENVPTLEIVAPPEV